MEDTSETPGVHPQDEKLNSETTPLTEVTRLNNLLEAKLLELDSFKDASAKALLQLMIDENPRKEVEFLFPLPDGRIAMYGKSHHKSVYDNGPVHRDTHLTSYTSLYVGKIGPEGFESDEQINLNLTQDSKQPTGFNGDYGVGISYRQRGEDGKWSESLDYPDAVSVIEKKIKDITTQKSPNNQTTSTSF